MHDNKPRQCLWVDPVQDPSAHGGYVPSLVVEGEPGHAPLLGSGSFARPWIWGQTLEEANRVCAQVNESTYGFSEVDAARIVLSSVFASC